MKYVILYITGLVLYGYFQESDPSMAFLVMLAWSTFPALKVSYRVAKIEDRRSERADTYRRKNDLYNR
jgi:hypothetical protein